VGGDGKEIDAESFTRVDSGGIARRRLWKLDVALQGEFFRMRETAEIETEFGVGVICMGISAGVVGRRDSSTDIPVMTPSEVRGDRGQATRLFQRMGG